MSQIDQLKPGETVEIEVGGKVLILEPIPYGRLKKLFKLVFKAMEKIGSMESKSVMASLPDIFEENIEEFCQLAFNPATHEFLNIEWVEDNLTLLHIREIAETLVAVNGIKDFLGRAGAIKAPVNREAIPASAGAAF